MIILSFMEHVGRIITPMQLEDMKFPHSNLDVVCMQLTYAENSTRRSYL